MRHPLLKERNGRPKELADLESLLATLGSKRDSVTSAEKEFLARLDEKALANAPLAGCGVQYKKPTFQQ